MFQFPASLCLSAYVRFTFGDLGVKGCMHLTRAYRSLPRPSSKFKPSYSSNSLSDLIFLTQTYIILLSKLVIMLFSLNIIPHRGLTSQTPQDSVAELGSSSVFLKANSAFLFLIKRVSVIYDI
jgi:hypothetical protein